jgi:hypothetical protein
MSSRGGRLRLRSEDPRRIPPPRARRLAMTASLAIAPAGSRRLGRSVAAVAAAILRTPCCRSPSTRRSTCSTSIRPGAADARARAEPAGARLPSRVRRRRRLIWSRGSRRARPPATRPSSGAIGTALAAIGAARRDPGPTSAGVVSDRPRRLSYPTVQRGRRRVACAARCATRECQPALTVIINRHRTARTVPMPTSSPAVVPRRGRGGASFYTTLFPDSRIVSVMRGRVRRPVVRRSTSCSRRRSSR